VGSEVSKATAKWVGFSRSIKSMSAMVNPKAADVFMPWDVRLGLLAKAKKALKIRAIPSKRKSF